MRHKILRCSVASAHLLFHHEVEGVRDTSFLGDKRPEKITAANLLEQETDRVFELD